MSIYTTNSSEWRLLCRIAKDCNVYGEMVSAIQSTLHLYSPKMLNRDTDLFNIFYLAHLEDGDVAIGKKVVVADYIFNMVLKFFKLPHYEPESIGFDAVGVNIKNCLSAKTITNYCCLFEKFLKEEKRQING